MASPTATSAPAPPPPAPTSQSPSVPDPSAEVRPTASWPVPVPLPPNDAAHLYSRSHVLPQPAPASQSASQPTATSRERAEPDAAHTPDAPVSSTAIPPSITANVPSSVSPTLPSAVASVPGLSSGDSAQSATQVATQAANQALAKSLPPQRRFALHPTAAAAVAKEAQTDEEAARRGSHKEVERRRRQAINDGIEALAGIVPGCGGSSDTNAQSGGRNMVNKGTVLARAVAYIKALKNNEASNIEKWTLEKLLMDQALGDSSAHADALTTELNRVHGIAEKLGIAHLFDPRADPASIRLPEHLDALRAQKSDGATEQAGSAPPPAPEEPRGEKRAYTPQDAEEDASKRPKE